MQVLFFVSILVLGHLAFVGSRMTTTLLALKLGGTTLTVGLLMSAFALLPMLLSVSAGRLIDRTGPRVPLLVSFAVLALGALLGFLLPGTATLFVSSTLVGTAFMFLHVAMNSVIGALGRPQDRALNFSWLALGFSTSGSLGPLVAGFAIDHLGHANAFALLAGFPALAFLLLALLRHPVPQPERHPSTGSANNVLDLLRVAALRRTFIASALLSTGWDLYAFLVPIYGAKLQLAATTIGLIMATFAGATFAVRLAMPALARRLGEWQVIGGALFVSGVSYALFPLVASVPLLMALSFLLGLGLGSAQPMIMALLFNTSPPGRQGEVVGVRTFTLNASHTFIPLATGALSSVIGTTPVFWAVAAALFAGSWALRRRRGPTSG